MKKLLSLSLIALTLAAKNCHAMDWAPNPNCKEAAVGQAFENKTDVLATIQESQSGLREEFTNALHNAQTREKKKNPEVLKNLVISSALYRIQLTKNPDQSKKVRIKTKTVYNKFNSDIKSSLKSKFPWNLCEELSDTEEEEESENKTSLPFKLYNDSKKKIELKEKNIQKLDQFKSTLKQLKQTNLTEEKSIEELRERIVNLKAELDQKEENNNKTKQQIQTQKTNIEQGKKVNKILVGLAQVKKESLLKQYEKIKKEIALQESMIISAQNGYSNANIELKATLKNNIKKATQEIEKLTTDKNEVELLIQKNKAHINGESTLLLNWVPKKINEWLFAQNEKKVIDLAQAPDEDEEE